MNNVCRFSAHPHIVDIYTNLHVGLGIPDWLRIGPKVSSSLVNKIGFYGLFYNNAIYTIGNGVSSSMLANLEKEINFETVHNQHQMVFSNPMPIMVLTVVILMPALVVLLALTTTLTCWVALWVILSHINVNITIAAVKRQRLPKLGLNLKKISKVPCRKNLTVVIIKIYLIWWQLRWKCWAMR